MLTGTFTVVDSGGSAVCDVARANYVRRGHYSRRLVG